MSFFLQKVEGSTERKQITSPADSIIEFKLTFKYILDKVYARRDKLKIVIVIDNIDRIPPDHARSFWATMQTFFAEGGGADPQQGLRYWLIAPFSVDALAFVFADSGAAPTPSAAKTKNGSSGEKDAPPTAEKVTNEASAKARAFVDKTFGLAFRVPPPILTNWRDYLLRQLEAAFPDHDPRDRFDVQDLFDIAHTGAVVPITPREMKLFVNGLVTIYLQQADEVSLPAMAAYLLHRDEIAGMAIPEELLTPAEYRHIAEVDWRASIAAIHFGVSRADATQILLQEPILAALREGSSDMLQKVEKQPGFYAVLRTLAPTEAGKPQRGNAVWLARIAASIGGLQDAGNPQLAGLWKNIRGLLRSVTDWESFQVASAEGVRCILEHTPSSEKPTLCSAIATSISQSPTPGPEALEPLQRAARNWIDTAMVVLVASTEKGPDIAMPGNTHFQLELVQQLVEIKTSPDVRARFKSLLDVNEQNGRLVEFIRTGGPIRNPTKLVPFLKNVIAFPADWAAVTNVGAERLRSIDIGAVEANSLVRLLLSMARTTHKPAFDALMHLSIQGHLSHLLHVRRENMETRAAILTAIVLANPSWNRSEQVEQSQNGDGDFDAFLNASEFDQALIGAIASLVVEIHAESRLFKIGGNHPRLSKLAATVIAAIVASGEALSISPEQVAERRGFLEKHPDILNGKAFIGGLRQSSDLLKLIASLNLPEYDVSLGWLIMRPFFLPRQAPYFHLREPSRSSWG